MDDGSLSPPSASDSDLFYPLLPDYSHLSTTITQAYYAMPYAIYPSGHGWLQTGRSDGMAPTAKHP